MAPMFRRLAFGVCSVLVAAACRDSSSSKPRDLAKVRYKATVYAPLVSAATTKDRTFVPRTARAKADAGANPAAPEALADYLGRGFGDVDPIASEGKRRGVVDFTSGWLQTENVSAADKNVEAWIKRP
jgi:hypothetical protein